MIRKRSSKSSRGFAFRRNNLSKILNRRAAFEPLESRQLLAVTFPVLGNQLVEAGAPLNLGLSATGTAPGNAISYSVSITPASGTPNLSYSIPTGNTFLKLQVDDAVDNIHGEMVFELYGDLTPITVQNITSLVNMDYYDGLVFHRILEQFMIQGGGFLPDGSFRNPSAPPYNIAQFQNEIDPELRFTGSGVLAMANAGPDTNTSQFFVTSGPTRFLDDNYTIFGMLVRGEEIRQALAKVPVVNNGSGEISKPVNSAIITSASIITDNTDAVLRLAATSNSTGTATVTVTATDTVTQETAARTFTVYVQPDIDTNNVAPVLAANAPNIGGTTAIAPLTFNVGALSTGTGATVITDANAGTPIGGIAVTGLTGLGTWKYALDGTSFVTIDKTKLGVASALLLSKDAKLQYTPDGSHNETPSITYLAWDMTFGNDGQLTRAQNSGGVSAFSTVSDTATLAVNTAPVLTRANPPVDSVIGPFLGATTKGTPVTINVSSFINNQAGTTTIADADAGAAIGGIAMLSASGTGTWAYSLSANGAFVDFTASEDSALLLPNEARLRFTPTGETSGVANISYRAWDKTTGTSGGRANLAKDPQTQTYLNVGGSTAFSEGADAAQLRINNAPVLAAANPSMGTTDEETAITIILNNTFINNGAGTTQITDPNTNALLGSIAIVGITGKGTWEYSLTPVSAFQPLKPVSSSSALLLVKDGSRLRYTPDHENAEVATITYVAWDRESNNKNGDRFNLSQAGATGEATAFSTASDTATLTVTAVNDAPVLTQANPVMGFTVSNAPVEVSLTAFIGDAAGKTKISDIDTGAVKGGIAVTGIQGSGTWKYSLDGTTFNAIDPTTDDTKALLLPKDAKLRYEPTDNTVQGTIHYRAWDTSSGAAGGTADISLPGALGGLTAFSLLEDMASVLVNNAPVLVPASPALPTTDENTPKDFALTSFINFGTGTTTITDADTDPIPVVGGIALTGVVGNGIWAYSIDGTTFLPVGTVGEASALLLPKTAKLRYTPDNKNGETASITYRAWDTNTGANGDKVNLSTAGATGGSTAFSTATDTATLSVAGLNDAPAIQAAAPSLGATKSNNPFTIGLTGSFINNQAGTTTISDVDNGAVLGGIALVGVTGGGTWSYSLDGTTFQAVGTVGEATALLLPKTAQLRYTPVSSSANETATIVYRAWDTTTGTDGGRADLTPANSTGGATAYSAGTDTASLRVNDAPVLTAHQPSLGTVGDASPTTADLATFINGAGTTTTITDPNTNAVVGGIALVEVTGGGTWSYSLDGTTFQAVGAVSQASALLLPKTAKLRYTPNGTGQSTIKYHAWDTTSGVAAGHADLSQAGSLGGATAFSADFDTAALEIKSAPSDITLALVNSSIPDNSPVGSKVGTFSTVSSQSGTYTYTLVPIAGSTDHESFSIGGDELKTAKTFNALIKNSYTIRVRTMNADNLSFEKTFTIAVTDATAPTVTINQQVGQADPTHAGSIYFLVVFSEPVSDFTTADVTLSGTATGAAVKKVLGSGATYEVQVSGMTGSGTVIATIAADKAHDAAGNGNLASTSTDNSVQFTKNWAIYSGTIKDDVFVFSPGQNAGAWQVKVNSTTWAIPAGYEGITLDGLGGNDTVKIVGNASNESYELWPDHATFKTGSFLVETANMEFHAFDGAGGGNSAIVHTGVKPSAFSLTNIQSRSLPSPSEFNGNATSDILWHNPSTGGVGAWLVQSGAFAGWAYLGMADYADWKSVGIGDFNADGSSDVLWHNQSTGAVGAWLVKGGVFQSWAYLGTANGGVWKVLGTGDFNGDGTADILWQNQSNGGVGAWLVKNGAYTSWAFLNTAATAMKHAGIGDFNADGTSDVLWQNTESSGENAGKIEAWLLRGGAFGGTSSIGTAASANWKPAGIGDFNADGTADALWHNQTTGAVEAWFLRNGLFNSKSTLGTAAAADWKPIGTGDYNGDGNADILWQNQTTGAGKGGVGAWLVKNGTFSWSYIHSADPAVWKPAGRSESGSFLKAESVAAATGATPLSQSDLQPIVREAVARWSNAGLDADAIARLSQVQFIITDLPDSELGKAEADRIYLDLDAAGNGWFVDLTPDLDEEYLLTAAKQLKAVDPRAIDHIDLLSVVEHELGHLAGFDDLDALAGDVMSGVLGVGIRR
ncbi:MAG: peptidylprolyl isomerase [Pirellulales bacterium]|nr:peptidylprolyl isomerase [Pirellulales bacterium]